MLLKEKGLTATFIYNINIKDIVPRTLPLVYSANIQKLCLDKNALLKN